MSITVKKEPIHVQPSPAQPTRDSRMRTMTMQETARQHIQFHAHKYVQRLIKLQKESRPAIVNYRLPKHSQLAEQHTLVVLEYFGLAGIQVKYFVDTLDNDAIFLQLTLPCSET